MDLAGGVVARGDANLSAYLRHVATTAPGGSHDSSGGVLTFAGGHAYPGTYTNGVIRLRDDVPAEEVLRRAEAFFRPLRRGYALWVRDHADADVEALAQRAGMFQRPPLEGNPGLAYAGPRLPPPSLGADVELRTVADAQTRQDYLGVVLGGYGMQGLPPDLAERVIFSTASLDDPRVAAFVAYLDRAPVAGAMSFTDGDTSGIEWVATLQAARGRGLGTAVFVAAHNAALDLGATLVVAQGSQLGTPLWCSLGYEVVTHYRRYLAKPPT